jgi:hypothetical protein
MRIDSMFRPGIVSAKENGFPEYWTGNSGVSDIIGTFTLNNSQNHDN